MNMNGISGSAYTNPMFQTPAQSTGGQTIQQSPQQVKPGPAEEKQEGMTTQRAENITGSESTKSRKGVDVYA